MPKARVVAIVAVSLAAALCAGAAEAAPFQPLLDEFWIVKNAGEIFRDSFTDGVLPPDGPDGPTTYGGSPIPGMTAEAGGKLTMTPSLGTTTIITGGFANTFTGALRTRSTNPASPSFLGVDSSFAVHGLFDLSSLPQAVGTGFGIRVNDRNGDPLNFNAGNDSVQLGVQRGGTPGGGPGDIQVALHEADFGLNTVDSVSLISIQGLLGVAAQIELIISKAAGSDLIAASYILYDAGNSVLDAQSLSTFSAAQNDFVRIYNGEAYTRAQFYALDQVAVPAPGSLALFSLGLGAFFLARVQRRGRDREKSIT